MFSIRSKKWNIVDFVSSVQSKVWNLTDIGGNVGTKRVGLLIFTLIVLVITTRG